MKTKTLIVIGVIGMAAALAPKARAGWSLNLTFSAPVVFRPPVVVAPAPLPVCPPRVVVSLAPVVCAPAPVYVPVRPAPGRPVAFIPPGHVRKLGWYDNDRHGWDRRDYDRGGWNRHGRH